MFESNVLWLIFHFGFFAFHITRSSRKPGGDACHLMFALGHLLFVAYYAVRLANYWAEK